MRQWVVAMSLGVACGSAPDAGVVVLDASPIDPDAQETDGATVADARLDEDHTVADVAVDTSPPDAPESRDDVAVFTDAEGSEVPPGDAVEVTGDPCASSVEEPNDDASSALALTAGARLDGRVCAGDTDWFSVRVPPRGALQIDVIFVHRAGDLDLVAYRRESELVAVAVSDSGDDDESVTLGPVAAETTFFIRLYGYQGARNTYALRAAITVDENLSPFEVMGRVRYEDRPNGPAGPTGELVAVPARRALVEAVLEADGRVVSAAWTDTEGRFLLASAALPGAAVTVRASAVAGVGGLRAEVRDRARPSRIYGITSAPLSVAAPAPVDLVARAQDPAGGAFNIADVAGDAFVFARRFTESEAPTLRVAWEPGRAFDCGSCYGDDTISLGGHEEDPDQYDDDIVLHEVGHHFVHHFGRDSSPGGTHRDRPVPPTLAFGEGLAYFLSSAIRDDGTMVDTFASSHRFIDYEAVTVNGASLDALYGTSDGTVAGRHREELDAAVLWDVFDSGSGEPHDTIALGAEAIMALLFGHFRMGPVDVGAPGIDLADFANAVVCAHPEHGAGVQALLDERRYPYAVGVGSCGTE